MTRKQGRSCESGNETVKFAWILPVAMAHLAAVNQTGML